ncbi:hypothetical protein NS228_15385 [Methylobacterium indicum]|uniref:Uncharacterized protein n=1 Tax=Methylobacterium indicum TaxID=1775910 RepID=A0A0J6RWE4_9HYPH|nr:hypothetical protein [Methylobacterium indicum]KMO22598.1 hypothetical protein QR78_06485 [Methylobacterium indicum]KMO25583.1 hypothetical protein QR79_06895 [Methylobacterium indicum]KTS13636.1 hypothetical protein NS229_28755 [Methylobacterium indicum]KTS39429.1 hypothetical protein NS228_15385 [Methylobacterium indicum]KTS44841.1 hypothetical protein NS230_24655 [Methylobacterium indicum]
MLNFLLGAVAGALMAAVATVAALRNPDVQVRMGMVRPEPVMVQTKRPDPVCPPAPPVQVQAASPQVGQPDMLFARRRFWSVAP